MKDDDTLIDNKEEILNEVSRFYGDLFQSIGKNPVVQSTQTKLLQYITVRVIEVQLEEIKQLPSREEVREILQSLPKGKAPGLDGLTMEVLLANWSFI